MSGLDRLATAANAEWAEAGLRRSPATFTQVRGACAAVGSRDYVLFSSSDYLGLAQHPAVKQAASDALADFGTGSTGSRLTTGTTAWHRRAEEEMARFLGCEDAVFFSSGYCANLSALQTIAVLAPDLTIFSDQLNHASIIDGCRLARKKVEIFGHEDLGALDDLLSRRETEHALVVSDGLFSMDGDIPDLKGLQELCARHGAWLYIDDAHACGTLGARGRGSAEHCGVPLPDILVVTASKALGAEGAFVCCTGPLGELLRSRARSFVFSTATPAATPAAIVAALGLIDAPLATLRARLAQFHQLVPSSGGVKGSDGMPTPHSHSPIVPILIGDERDAAAASARLRESGLWVPAIRYPTVARGAAILRVTITAHHTAEQIRQLADALADVTAAPADR